MSKRSFRFFIALVIIVVLLAAAWVAGWQITGELNPVNWVKQEQSDDTEKDNINLVGYTLEI